jgi:hypothetical protein
MRIIAVTIAVVIIGSLLASLGLFVAARSGGSAAANSQEFIRSSMNALYLLSEPHVKDQTANATPHQKGPMPDK